MADIGVLAVGTFRVAAAGGARKASHVRAGSFFGPVTIVGWWCGGCGGGCGGGVVNVDEVNVDVVKRGKGDKVIRQCGEVMQYTLHVCIHVML